MNNIYRLVWNRAINQWVVACEFARSTQRGASRARAGGSMRGAVPMLTVLSMSLSLAGIVQAAPIGGQITAGAGSISQKSFTTTIQQTSQNLSLNWQGFNLASNETVNFVQPGSSAIAVNRIQSSTGSQILGNINANGQVWLINPNGILFGQNAQVNVGGLVASTLNVSDSALGSKTASFSGKGTGSVINKGTINAASGGYVALLGNTVSNQGVITATLGTVALGGGSAETLTFSGDQLLHLQVDQSTLNNLAENQQLIQADGGQVTMTAGAKEAVLASVVNNTGVIYARTVSEHNGVITLLGGMQAGHVKVGGTLDASAPNGGNGGAIETSAAQVSIATSAIINASAKQGKSGTWLIDPTDLTIDTAAAATIANTLTGGTDVMEQTTSNGASGFGTQTSGAGDINVNAAINWTNIGSKLTLSAYHAINVNAAVNGSGSVVMDAIGGNLTIASGASVNGNAGVTLATGANFINNAGATAVTASSGKWLIYSASPTLNSNGGLTPNFIQYDAPYQTAPLLPTGNAFLYSVAPSLTVTGLSGTVSKTYDGNTSAVLTSANVAGSGFINGDTLVSMAGTYGSPNAGVNTPVTSSLVPTGLVAQNTSGINVYGYGITGPAVTSGIGTITPVLLTASITGSPTKVYDGTTTATLTASNYTLAGFIGSENATVNQPASVSYGASNAGPQTVSATFAIPNFVPNSGTNLRNYTLPSSATGAGVINKAPVEVTGVLSNNKVYDGSTADVLNIANAGLYGVIPIDANSAAVSLVSSGANGQFATANVGNNLAVSVNGFALSGTSANNYQIVPPSNLVASITPKSLTITGLTATNKVYDGSQVDGLNTGTAALSGVVLADRANVLISTSNAIGAFASANAGTALAVSSTGFGITGTAASNYVLAQPSGLTANITPVLLGISVIGNPTKIYNGSTTAALGSGNFSISGVVNGESVVVSQNTSSSYSSVNAGTQAVTTTLSSSDFSVGGGTLLSNYSFPSTVNGSGSITPAPLTVGISNNPSKVYDSTTTGTLSTANYAISGFVQGQSATINHTSAVYASANAGVEPISTSIVASDYTAAQGTLLSNYSLPTNIFGFGTITPIVIAMHVQASIVNNPSKPYDGTSVATLTPSNYSLSGFLSGQGATVNQTAGHYSSVNAGVQPVSATLTSTDFAANTGTDLNNYTLPTSAYGTGTITPKTLNVMIVNDPTKTYNGVTATVLGASNYVISGFVGSESAQINQSAVINYAGSNAGAHGITAMLTSSDYTPNGALLTNYVLPILATGTGHINPAPLTVKGILATDKVYNSTTADALNTTNAVLTGVIASDVNNISLVDGAAAGTFSSANAGSNLLVTPTGISISGSAVGNYILQPLSALTANINQAPLSVLGVSANNKPYDSTTAATLNNANATLSALQGTQDVVTLSSSAATGSFGSVNIGNQLSVGATGFALAGAQAGNYVLSQPTGLAADITPALITAVIIGTPTKAYDGTSSTTLTAANYTLSGFVSGQNATVPQSATANYTSSDAGHSVPVTSTLVLSDFVASAGTQLSNYLLPSTAAGLGVITPAQLTAIIIGNPTKTYDGTPSASLTSSNYVLSGFVGSEGQGGYVNQTIGSYGSANTGPEPVSANLAANSFSGLAGTNLNNYILPVSAVGNGTIKPAPLTVVNVTTTSRPYDGTTVDALSGATLSGTIYGNDAPSLSNATTGTLSSRGNVGTDAVTTAMTLTGLGSSNYTITQPGPLSAVITPVTLSATSAVSKTYDGTNVANLSGTNTVLTGFVSGQGASVNSGVTGTFSQSDVNTTPLTITGGALTAANLTPNTRTLLSNYTLPSTDNGVGNITAATLTYVATPATYQYGLTIPTTQAGNVTGFVHGETLAGATTGNLVFTTTATNQSNVGTYVIDGNGLTANNGNYVFVEAAANATALRITPAPLTVINVATTPRAYDGTTVDILTGATLSGTLYNNNTMPTLSNATTGVLSNSGNVGNDSVTTAMTLTGNNSSNYAITQPINLFAAISPVLLSATSTASRTYDGTNSADISGSNTTFFGFLPGQGASVNRGVTGSFSQVNAGSSLAITGGALTASSISANTGTLLSNYTLPSSDNGTGSINAKVINLSGTRVYDGMTDANANIFSTINTGVGTESLSLVGSGTLPNKSVGSSGLQSLGTLALVDGTGLKNNYTLVGGNDTVNITPLTITVNAVGLNKSYNANTTDAVTLSSAGVFNTDTVTFANTSANFIDKNVGSAKLVNVAGITAHGVDAGNYVVNTTANTIADITTLAITVNATGMNKVYNANTADAVTLSSAGVFTTDAVTFVSTNANFIDKNIGTAKSVTVAGITARGVDAGNYVFNTMASTTANITPVTITVNATGMNKVYDANTIDTVILSSAGIFNTDTVTFASTGANFIDKNVGPVKVVNVTGISASGVDAINYVINTTSSTTANITPLSITVKAVGTDKIYNANSADAVTLSSTGVLGTDAINFASAPASFIDKNAGQVKTVNVSGIIASGGDAGNYVINTTATTTANITPLAITVNAVGTDKVYNGNAIDSVALITNGLLGTDKVSFADTSANFVDKNVGPQKTVNVTGITASGIDAGNYGFNSTTFTSANITAAIVNLSGVRFIDGTSNANGSIFGSNGIVSGLNGDTLRVAGNGSLASKNMGIQPLVSFGTLALSDGSGLASNYTLIGGVDTVNIMSIPVPTTTTAFIQTFLHMDNVIATPYGVASSSAVANFTGNHKKTRYNPIEASANIADFQTGLELNVQGNGLRLSNGVAP